MRCTALVVLVVLTPLLCAEPAAPAPQLIAHRGLLRHAPENTLSAFASCLELRLGFELDVRRSKDGHLVVLHDTNLTRTTTGKGEVAQFTLEALRKLDAGAWFDAAYTGQRIPTLEEVFALVQSRGSEVTLIAVDLKANDDRIEAEVVALAKKHGILSRLVLIGTTIESPAVRRRLLTADALTPVAMLAQTSTDLATVLAVPDVRWAYLRFVPTRKEVEQTHRAGKKVLVVGPTVAGSEPANWQKVRAAGVDAMLTDYPLECRQEWRKKR